MLSGCMEQTVLLTELHKKLVEVEVAEGNGNFVGAAGATGAKSQ